MIVFKTEIKDAYRPRYRGHKPLRSSSRVIGKVAQRSLFKDWLEGGLVYGSFVHELLPNKIVLKDFIYGEEHTYTLSGRVNELIPFYEVLDTYLRVYLEVHCPRLEVREHLSVAEVLSMYYNEHVTIRDHKDLVRIEVALRRTLVKVIGRTTTSTAVMKLEDIIQATVKHYYGE